MSPVARRNLLSRSRRYFHVCLIILSFGAVLGLKTVNADSFSALPLISRLDNRDTIFRQYISDVETARQRLFSQRGGSSADFASYLTIYSYAPQTGDGLMAIAARCNVPYATLASLNRISNIEESLSRTILLPSMPGLFVPETPGTDLEKLLFSSRADNGVLLSIPREGRTESFLFFPGDDFSATERVFFLNQGFRFPLRDFRLTSPFGSRMNPVTGMPSMHQGLDLAAPEGSEVFAVRNGTVVDIGQDPVLGTYIILNHDNNWVSLYGHLSSVTTSLNSEVQSGSMIGRVGTTGQSTGPHLHFELRQGGQIRDPARHLRSFR